MIRTWLSIVILAACLGSGLAIRCWKCDNAIDNDDCIANGRAIWCRGNQHGCQTEARYHIGLIPPIRITKRCKQGLACDNNVGQNEKGFFPFQCNPHIPESICRCCCETDDCNKPELGCLPEYPTCRNLIVPENGVMECHFGTEPPSVGEVCQFKCDQGYDLKGYDTLSCEAVRRDLAEWDYDEPTCEPRRCLPPYTTLENGFVSCTNENIVGSICTHECDPGFVYQGSLVATCMDSENWDYPQPECIPITCPPPLEAPLNGMMDCTNFNYEGSSCSFTCDEGYTIQGNPFSDCLDDFNGDRYGVWSDPVPKCVPLLCQPQSRNPDNGVVQCTNENYGGSVCTYSCKPGFAPDGPPSRSCEDDGDGDAIGEWTDPEPKCVPIKCIPPHTNPTDGYVACDNQNFLGSVCDFYCNDGNRLRGSALSICEDDGDGDAIGRWSDPPPTCQTGPCQPELTDPSNGIVTCTDRNNIRSVCTFTCNEGFYMAEESGDAVRSGRSQLTCRPDSTWSKEPPMCLPIKCNPPHRETDILGVDCSNDNNYKSICKFSCKDGSRPDGPQSSTCEDDDGDAEGVWVPPRPPSCRPQFCQPPQVHPQNGRVRCSNRNMHGSICTFTCNPGFYLESPARKPVGAVNYETECEGTQWTKGPPRCAPITCKPPHTNPANGNVRCSRGNNYKSRCSFTCDVGYQMTGFPTSTCEDDGNGDELGEWSNPPPSCESSGCSPPLRTPDNGKMTCTDGSNFKSVCTFNCNSGYYMVTAGGTTVTRNILASNCPANNIWTEQEPTCRPITCPPPRTDPKNGDVSCTNDVQYQSLCTYTCDPGYKLSSNFPTTLCDDDGNGDSIGEWTRPPPRCNPTACSPKQIPPRNGKVSCTNGDNFGSVCTFTCNSGYYMVDAGDAVVPGNRDRTECMSDNTWSKPRPECLPITCIPPHVDPLNGEVKCSNRNNYMSKCSFTCKPGYDRVGSPSSTCEDDNDDDEHGVWTDPPPTCSLGACRPPLDPPDHGRMDCTDGTSVGSICTFECDSGYYMVDGSRPVRLNLLESECMPTKSWSKKTPSCKPIRCKPPHSNPKNGKVICSNTNFYASECSFTCENGFDLIPGRGSLQTELPYFSVCEEDDVPGDENGRWSDPAPTCARGACNPPRVAPENGAITCTNANFLESVCTYSCDDGFYMEGPDLSVKPRNRWQTTCEKNLDWSEGPPTCKPITCIPPHTDPDNGGVECTNENFHRSTCSFNCNPQYSLVGSPRSRCMDDGDGNPFGEWSEPPPTCEENFCKPASPGEPVDGYTVCTDANNFGSVCEFACNDYHRRVGPLYSKCVRNRRGELEWTNPPPRCEKNECEDRMGEFPHGEMSCTKKNCATSVCSYACLEEGYSLYPKGIDTNTCRNDTTWDRRKPCCVRPCPPNAEMDLIVVLDSSSSVGEPNWVIMKEFVRGILASFTVAPDTTNFGVFRFNGEVDTTTQILLKDFTSDKEAMLKMYDRIGYSGRGTNTKKALEHVRDTMLLARNGNRPRVPDLLMVLTDGKSQEPVERISDELREMGVFIFVVGIKPPRGDLDLVQLNQIAGNPENLMIREGFGELTVDFALQLTDKVCGDPCVHRTHPHHSD